MLADELALHNTLNINVVYVRKLGQSITCLSLPMTGQPYPQDGAQTHHIALCLVAYLIVERERLDQHCTWRQLKRRLILRGSRVTLPALERVRAAA